MKKIYRFFKGVLKGILGNLDYVATFVLGAAAYKFAPEQLEATKEAILTFDYASAWMWIKGAGVTVADYAVLAYDWVVSLFADAPAVAE